MGDGPDEFVIPNTSPGAVWILSLDDRWFDEGHALVGVNGLPRLVGSGTLTAGSPGALTLDSARPSAIGTLHVSLSSTPKPFKGGTLVPFPPVLNIPFVTDRRSVTRTAGLSSSMPPRSR